MAFSLFFYLPVIMPFGVELHGATDNTILHFELKLVTSRLGCVEPLTLFHNIFTLLWNVFMKCEVYVAWVFVARLLRYGI